jgi:hypothetical protein
MFSRNKLLCFIIALLLAGACDLTDQSKKSSGDKENKAKTPEELAEEEAKRLAAEAGIKPLLSYSDLLSSRQLELWDEAKGYVVNRNVAELDKALKTLGGNACADNAQGYNLFYYLFFRSDNGKLRLFQELMTQIAHILIKTNCDLDTAESNNTWPDGISAVGVAKEAAKADPKYNNILTAFKYYEPNLAIKEKINALAIDAFNGRDLKTEPEIKQRAKAVIDAFKSIQFTRKGTQDLAKELIDERENKPVTKASDLSGEKGIGGYEGEANADVPLNIRLARFLNTING